MKTKVNYFAVATFYIIAISLRYLTNKTSLLDGISNEFLKIIVQAAGPAIGACVAFLAFRIKPVLSLKGNYNKPGVPLDQNEKLWGDAIRNIFGVLNFRDGRFIQGTFKNIITSNYI